MGNKNEIVYKCNSKHCTDGGYHAKGKGRTITLKLFIGTECPLDFEDTTTQTITVVRDNNVKPVETTIEQPVMPMPQRPRRSVVPPTFMKAMTPPPGMSLNGQ